MHHPKQTVNHHGRLFSTLSRRGGGHSSLEYSACRKDSMRSRINLRYHSGRYTTGNNNSIAGLSDGLVR
jgi:hypothetical protein